MARGIDVSDETVALLWPNLAATAHDPEFDDFSAQVIAKLRPELQKIVKTVPEVGHFLQNYPMKSKEVNETLRYMARNPETRAWAFEQVADLNRQVEEHPELVERLAERARDPALFLAAIPAPIGIAGPPQALERRLACRHRRGPHSRAGPLLALDRRPPGRGRGQPDLAAFF
mmetsp:Transcript_55542/g.154747  ORF Transcript_55542/g.154747 Transcript_55542/m.154747 type:complete len:173 (-) Transcript_55542:63-581(-)